MRKGHLDAEQLEKDMKKDELQELARKLGVSAEGTKAEIAARCAAVEVDIPDEDEPEPDKEPETEQPTGQPPEPDKEPEQEQPTGQPPEPDKEPEQKPGSVEIEVVETYRDLVLRKLLKKGTRKTMDTDRANYLVERGLVKIVED